MTAFGLSLIAVIITAFLPWSYVLGGRLTLPRTLSFAVLIIDTALF